MTDFINMPADEVNRMAFKRIMGRETHLVGEIYNGPATNAAAERELLEHIRKTSGMKGIGQLRVCLSEILESRGAKDGLLSDYLMFGEVGDIARAALAAQERMTANVRNA
ncbi:MAG: hypothetical protein IMZ62_12910 [Chloroflexi bacterium]|nr:hypothetical protein [Chloroflexota bacterium]MBE3119104.1 hypothetical protein [Candidatus Atribacteria bacterium]